MPFRPGFDPRWTDEADYILGITHDIWEGRRIAELTDWYADDLIVRSPASVVQGNQGIIAATLATLAEFPDRELLGEDVIWCGVDADSFLSSHRLLCTATHSGAGVYGAPTGRPAGVPHSRRLLLSRRSGGRRMAGPRSRGNWCASWDMTQRNGLGH